MTGQSPLETYFRANTGRRIHKWVHYFDIYHRHLERFRGRDVVVLEFGQPDGALFGRLFRFYSHRVLPRLGGLITGQRLAYAYLDRTASAFPAGDRFVALMHEAGCFAEVTATPLTGGVAFVYVGVRGKA